jgi:hypothetical protein
MPAALEILLDFKKRQCCIEAGDEYMGEHTEQWMDTEGLPALEG